MTPQLNQQLETAARIPERIETATERQARIVGQDDPLLVGLRVGNYIWLAVNGRRHDGLFYWLD